MQEYSECCNLQKSISHPELVSVSKRFRNEFGMTVIQRGDRFSQVLLLCLQKNAMNSPR